MNVTIHDRAAGTSAVPEVIPTDVETLLRCLVGRLVDSAHQLGQGRNDLATAGQILLDVEVGDVRFLALRLGRPSPISLLSPREQEIARMVASGHPNKTIASVLEISAWTVASHLRRIFIKLEVSSRAAMAARLSAPALSELPPLHIAAARHGHPARISRRGNQK
jgi:DNA-binding CsgD family transcriptional regulator